MLKSYHVDLFCVHLLRTFIHIQVDKIPVKYIFKRYTKFARNELAFSREDKLLTGADGNTTSYRTKLLLTKSTKVVQAGTMSNAAFQRAIEVMDSLFNEIKDVPHDIRPNSNVTGRNTTGQVLFQLFSMLFYLFLLIVCCLILNLEGSVFQISVFYCFNFQSEYFQSSVVLPLNFSLHYFALYFSLQ